MSLGHVTKILPVLSVAPFRQGHKTDKNDALAVVEAATRPNIKEAPFKTADQQAIQSIQRSREILVGDRAALSNHIREILLEFGIVIRQGLNPLHQTVKAFEPERSLRGEPASVARFVKSEIPALPPGHESVHKGKDPRDGKIFVHSAYVRVS